MLGGCMELRTIQRLYAHTHTWGLRRVKRFIRGLNKRRLLGICWPKDNLHFSFGLNPPPPTFSGASVVTQPASNKCWMSYCKGRKEKATQDVELLQDGPTRVLCLYRTGLSECNVSECRTSLNVLFALYILRKAVARLLDSVAYSSVRYSASTNEIRNCSYPMHPTGPILLLHNPSDWGSSTYWFECFTKQKLFVYLYAVYRDSPVSLGALPSFNRRRRSVAAGGRMSNCQKSKFVQEKTKPRLFFLSFCI